MNYNELSIEEKNRLNTYPVSCKTNKEKQELKKKLKIKPSNQYSNYYFFTCDCGKSFNKYLYSEHCITLHHRLFTLNKERAMYGLEDLCGIYEGDEKEI